MSWILSAPVLLVEDDPVSAARATQALREIGATVEHAASGEEAIQRIAEGHYRIVVSDWIMPGLDGIELCRHVRDREGPYVYFLLCSARESRERRLEAYAAGVDDFLGKPLDVEDLNARLTVARRVLDAEDRLAAQRDEMEARAKENFELGESLKLASRRFEDLFSGLPVACFTFDSRGFVYEWNRAAESSFGIAAFDTVLRPVWDVLNLGGEAWTEARCEAMLRGAGPDEFEWAYGDPDDAREFLCRVIALRGRDGSIVGAVCANADVTAHKRAERTLAMEKASLESANARLHELASKDGLTGLLNRRSFMNELDIALAEYHRKGTPFSLVLLDIDRFKDYNDTFGHPAGDEVLRRFSRVLRTSARSYEQPARYGGEEFAIVLHDTPVAKGLAAAERFRKAVENADWLERPVTCSLGVSTVGTDGETPEALIAAADAALYASKSQGRNRVSHSAGLPLAKAA